MHGCLFEQLSAVWFLHWPIFGGKTPCSYKPVIDKWIAVQPTLCCLFIVWICLHTIFIHFSQIEGWLVFWSLSEHILINWEGVFPKKNEKGRYENNNDGTILVQTEKNKRPTSHLDTPFSPPLRLSSPLPQNRPMARPVFWALVSPKAFWTTKFCKEWIHVSAVFLTGMFFYVVDVSFAVDVFFQLCLKTIGKN